MAMLACIGWFHVAGGFHIIGDYAAWYTKTKRKSTEVEREKGEEGGGWVGVGRRGPVVRRQVTQEEECSGRRGMQGRNF